MYLGSYIDTSVIILLPAKQSWVLFWKRTKGGAFLLKTIKILTILTKSKNNDIFYLNMKAKENTKYLKQN